MEKKRLTEEALLRRRGALERLAARPRVFEADGTAAPAPAAERILYGLKSPEGRQLYESFSDAELLALLRAAAQELGHAPAQRELFWVYRNYLLERFSKWPYALKLAGLSKAAGRGGKSTTQAEAEAQELENLLSLVREKTLELGRTPHPTDLPEVCAALKKQFKTWGEVLVAAEVSAVREKIVAIIPDLEPQYRAQLAELRAQAQALGRAPQRKEVPEDTRSALIARCGSWRNALFQIGLEPVTRIAPFSTAYLKQKPKSLKKQHRGTLYDCYYRVLHPDAATVAQLDQLSEIAKALGRSPEKHEVPQELRRALQDACGSWSNALFQRNLQPKSDPKTNLFGGKTK